MFSRQVLIGQSRLFSSIDFKFCESINGSHHRYQNAKYVYKSSPTLNFARLASSSSGVPTEITKVIEKVAADSPSANWPSVEALVSSVGPLPDVPQPPALPTPPPLEILANGEPSLASLGLGGYWPNGICQQVLEAIHLHLDIPWWSSLVLMTAIVRTCLFPLVVKQIKASTSLATDMPQFAALQQRFSAARANNDHHSVASCALEIEQFWKNKPHGPLSTLGYMFVQASILISITSGLRSMCNLPVESLRTGGFWHVQDLTGHDPTYLLPIACGLAIHMTLRLGVDFTVSSHSAAMKYITLYGFPLFTTAVAIYMENFICVYWLANSGIAIVQSRVIRSPKVKKYFQIPDVKPPPRPAPGKQKGFMEGIQEGLKNVRVAREVQERKLMDELTFEQAGREPLRKTYKYNPKATAAPTKVNKKARD